jgi:hypothetical protein
MTTTAYDPTELSVDELDALCVQWPVLANLRLAAVTAAERAETAWIASASAYGSYISAARAFAGVEV